MHGWDPYAYAYAREVDCARVAEGHRSVANSLLPPLDIDYRRSTSAGPFYSVPLSLVSHDECVGVEPRRLTPGTCTHLHVLPPARHCHSSI